MEIGFDFVAATPRRDRDDPETAPVQQRMAPVGAPRRNPSTDQKRTRRQIARQAGLADFSGETPGWYLVGRGVGADGPDLVDGPYASAAEARADLGPDLGTGVLSVKYWNGTTLSTTSTKESSMPTEADLLAKMAAAPTLPEQRQFAAELATLRQAKTAAAREDAALGFAREAVQARYPMLAPAQFTQHTAATDWLGEVVPDTYDTRKVEATMRAEASLWYDARPDFVKADASEVMAQARGIAARQASQYGPAAEGARHAFLDTVAHLTRVADGVQAPPYQVPSGSSLPVGVDNKDTFDDSLSAPADPKSTANTGNAPSLAEGDAPEGDAAQGIENPLAGEHAADSKDTAATDYIDGTKTQARRTAGSVAPAWLHERVNDGYGTPNKAYDKESGTYYDHPFWAENPAEVVGDYKVFQRDGQWWGYNTRQNMWTTGQPSREAVVQIAGGTKGLDMNASLRVAGDGSFAADTSHVPSLTEGDAPEGDHAEPVIVGEHPTADAGPGNGPATDSIDGTVYPKQGAAEGATQAEHDRRTELATKVGPLTPTEKAELERLNAKGPFRQGSLRAVAASIQSAGAVEATLAPFVQALAALPSVDASFGGVPGRAIVTHVLAKVALTNAEREVLTRHLAGEVPPQFLEQQKKKSDDGDDADKDSDSDSDSDKDVPDFIQKKIEDKSAVNDHMDGRICPPGVQCIRCHPDDFKGNPKGKQDVKSSSIDPEFARRVQANLRAR